MLLSVNCSLFLVWTLSLSNSGCTRDFYRILTKVNKILPQLINTDLQSINQSMNQSFIHLSSQLFILKKRNNKTQKFKLLGLFYIYKVNV